jgi:shikimate dehydrogenase
MRTFGLIGNPLSHSFSKAYFTNKFQKEGISDAQYELFEIDSIVKLPVILEKNPQLAGLNVTIPYKVQVMEYLDEVDTIAIEIGAVNTIKIHHDRLFGYNTDYDGFKNSLTKFLGPNELPKKALILGTGGASLAVRQVLMDLGIDFQLVSRIASEEAISYEDVIQDSILNTHHLVVNTTPLGTHPNVDELPNLPYEQLTPNHFLFDLVYNPLVTAFMQKGIDAGCWVKNGLEMLHGQAEKAWEIWNQ